MIPLSLWLVEDEPAYQAAFADVVAQANDLNLRSTYSSFGELAGVLHSTPDSSLPDLLVMDIRMPGVDGIEATRRFRLHTSSTPVLVLTNVDEPRYVFDALRAGASGYVLKDRIVDALGPAVRQVARGGMGFSPGVAEHVAGFFEPQAPSPLSTREEEIIRLMARGMSQKRIADELFISPHTVDTHVRNIYSKLHASSGLEAVAIASQMRIITEADLPTRRPPDPP